MNFKSWKTSASGVVVVILQLLPLLFPTVVTHDVANALTALAVAVGLINAKDSNVTGGTVVNDPNSAAAVSSAAKTNKV
jgi:hypothetical protein